MLVQFIVTYGANDLSSIIVLAKHSKPVHRQLPDKLKGQFEGI